MSREIVQIQGTELNDFIKEVENNQDVKIMLSQFKRDGKLKSTEYNILKAGKSQLTDTYISFLVLGFERDTIKIIASKTDMGTIAHASIMENKDGKEVLKGFRVVHGQTENMLTVDYDDKLKQNLLELDNTDIPELSRDTGVKVNLPCIYGNWCGPLCSGPDAPISPVDSCCKQHDNCYGAYGYFDCGCDLILKACLAPYALAGSEYAILVFSWFTAQPCIYH